GFCGSRPGLMALVVVIGLVGGLVSSGCAGGAGSSTLDFYGSPYYSTGPQESTAQGPGSSGRVPGGTLGGGSRVNVDPCQETPQRKQIRISMRNISSDYIHYFLVLVAYVNSDTHPDGAVCPEDTSMYESAGYIYISEGDESPFGNECIEGPALYYFHEKGRFQGAGTTGLASAIAPAQGTSATYDAVFGPSGKQMPVPDIIWFHNPDTGEGKHLKYSPGLSDACDPNVIEIAAGPCDQDSFYYVDSFDMKAGSNPGGGDPYVRFPSEIQGTGCLCGLGNDPWAALAPSGATAADKRCNEFFRGGRVDFVFLRDDTEPPYPQLVWRVTDSSNGLAHDFDERAEIP
ncbi:MAG: hypothetical protein KAY37_10500, partial [Phycisphaerae bacterium]|nr:hypothetical protein [Phycisphaerae bacterium]